MIRCQTNAPGSSLSLIKRVWRFDFASLQLHTGKRQGPWVSRFCNAPMVNGASPAQSLLLLLKSGIFYIVGLDTDMLKIILRFCIM